MIHFWLERNIKEEGNRLLASLLCGTGSLVPGFLWFANHYPHVVEIPELSDEGLLVGCLTKRSFNHDFLAP